MRTLLAYLSILSYLTNASCSETAAWSTAPPSPPCPGCPAPSSCWSLQTSKMERAPGMNTYTRLQLFGGRRQVLGQLLGRRQVLGPLPRALSGAGPPGRRPPPARHRSAAPAPEVTSLTQAGHGRHPPPPHVLDQAASPGRKADPCLIPHLYRPHLCLMRIPQTARQEHPADPEHHADHRCAALTPYSRMVSVVMVEGLSPPSWYARPCPLPLLCPTRASSPQLINPSCA